MMSDLDIIKQYAALRSGQPLPVSLDRVMQSLIRLVLPLVDPPPVEKTLSRDEWQTKPLEDVKLGKSITLPPGGYVVWDDPKDT